MTVEELSLDISRTIEQVKMRVLALRNTGQHLAAKQLSDQLRVVNQEVAAYATPDETMMENFLLHQLKRLEALK